MTWDRLAGTAGAALTGLVIGVFLHAPLPPLGRAATPPVPAASGAVQVGFSPEAGAEQLVVDTIASARSSIRLAAYSFTSPSVVRALIDARRRGVDIAVVADRRANLDEDRSGKGRHALNSLALAGIPVRIVSAYAIHHDKYAVVDRQTVQTGSFNYTASAASRNSENVLVLRDAPDIARAHLDHWQSRWNQGTDYAPTP